MKSTPPILSNKHYEESSVFTPANLLREARRQKRLVKCNVPEICILDPDGDILHYLLRSGNAKVICFAHLTNTMAKTEGDFEKGAENGSIDSIRLIHETINLLK